MVESEQTRVLIDTTPDMREQLLAAEVSLLDAVIWTHDHADHANGVDDLRQVQARHGGVVPAYARPASRAVLARRFDYVFEGRGSYPPTAQMQDLPEILAIGDIAIRCVDQPHGSITSAGLRFEHAGRSIAYSTDFNRMTEEMSTLYEGLDVWIVDCLRTAPHPTHPHLAQVLDWIAALRPRRAIFTHMDVTMDYARLRASLPANVEPGYDGLEVLV
jgi:phosphoribosyl 1,2-cyclic phosphate phosphodiesterase